jgi:hypothetical protein
MEALWENRPADGNELPSLRQTLEQKNTELDELSAGLEIDKSLALELSSKLAAYEIRLSDRDKSLSEQYRGLETCFYLKV